MLDPAFEERLEKLFDHGYHVWFLGAGASVESHLPLMNGLTARVFDKLESGEISKECDLTIGELLDSIRNQIGESANIENILDHLSDFASMAYRSNGHVFFPIVKTASSRETFKYKRLRYDELMSVRAKILAEIRESIRWGYVHDDDPSKRRSGQIGQSIVDVGPQLEFVEALFGGLFAARERRLRPVEFVTTNYDTLIEDALALYGIPYVDGFRGGAVGYWDATVYPDPDGTSSGVRASVTKIHGSIDWALTEAQRIVRRRIGDTYPSGDGREVLIYPQGTKYEFVRREPFDSLFQRFRAILGRQASQVLFVCGYAFGDDHVNREFEEALARPGSQLTMVAFSRYRVDILKRWGERSFGERVYVLTEDGAWCGTEGPYETGNRNLWRFSEVIKLLQQGGRLA